MRALILACVRLRPGRLGRDPGDAPMGPRSVCPDCLVMTPAQVQAEKDRVLQLVRESYELGRTAQKASCISLVQLIDPVHYRP
jgi:hypothetical protein